MKVILKKEVEKLGDIGDVVTVKDGYARNYLIPRGLAVRATEGMLKAIEEEKKQKAFKIERERKAARELAESLERLLLNVKAKAGEEGRLYGAITTQMIADKLKDKGFEIDRKQITIDPPIKQVGKHEVSIKLYSDVVAKLKLEVEAEAAG
ncbi:MAG: 50S ribosomal protein L9 [Chloroherpetonaceae bacterium]|nr:50S ribosomal protein L9 [Chloroherpetonaceae bacterium]MDW8437815.1 50S ribosomal protein L9 [Chloroherpetonaceae bacterium]